MIIMEIAIPSEQLDFLSRVKQFVEEEFNPISLQVETLGEIPQEIVEKMRVL